MVVNLDNLELVGSGNFSGLVLRRFVVILNSLRSVFVLLIFSGLVACGDFENQAELSLTPATSSTSSPTLTDTPASTPTATITPTPTPQTGEIPIPETEEAAEVQQVMNRYNTPLLGFYSGVEVAPILGKSRGLDWTGVLMVLAKDK